MPLVTKAEAARILGVTPEAVYRACKAGRLSTVTTVSGGVRIESDTMLAEWRRNTQSRVNGPRDLRSRSEAAGTQPKPLRPAAERMSAGTSSSPRPSATRESIPDYDESRARTEHLKAELLELDRQQKLGTLVPLSDVELRWTALVTATRTKLLAVPSKAKQQLPELDIAAIGILDSIIRQALDDLANGIIDDSTDTDE